MEKEIFTSKECLREERKRKRWMYRQRLRERGRERERWVYKQRVRKRHFDKQIIEGRKGERIIDK